MEDAYKFLIGVLLVAVSMFVATFIGFQMLMLPVWLLGMVITFYYIFPEGGVKSFEHGRT
jgi:hypothetical protein